MARGTDGEALKCENRDIGSHLRNATHLSNGIHLKNHGNRPKHQSTDERSLLRDLIFLQRSRSLRDPSTNTILALHSPSISVSSVRHLDGDASTNKERKSKQFKGWKERRGLSTTSHLVSEMSGSKKTSKRKNHGSNAPRFKTLMEQLKEVSVSSEYFGNGHDNLPLGMNRKDIGTGVYGNHHGLNRTNKHKERGTRTTTIGNIDSPNGLSMDSNPFENFSHQKYHEEGGNDEDEEQDVVTRTPRNGCGIPWNWSRIHHRGKTFLDLAGRSLSCGRSDSKLKNSNGPAPQTHRRTSSRIYDSSDDWSSFSKSVSDVLPLLPEPSVSQESMENAVWPHEYLGELGIYSDGSLTRDQDSVLASRRKFPSRYQNLTEKYAPKTFMGLVGQSLVAQALSNSVYRNKVEFLYVFYGPHGSGKTACARIFARALNCLSQKEPKPCNACDSCVSQILGKSHNVQEFSPLQRLNFKNIMNLFESTATFHFSSRYRVVIFDDYDTLSKESWNVILKVIERAPRRAVFVFISATLDHLPHTIVSKCQKYYFPKLKETDIICTLREITEKENVVIEEEALRLIASSSDGSLRDAEMTLDQLCLFGKRISVPLVQELVGLISNEKLVELLDLALSADAVNTVKNLREIMEAGVEPLALMSQLATMITDILAGSYVFTKERLPRRFFRNAILSKVDMQRLRRALQTLSDAEKQLRTSNDRLTWLTAALLQLAPEPPYIPQNPSEVRNSIKKSSVGNNRIQREVAGKDNEKRNPALLIDKGKGDKVPHVISREVEEIWQLVLDKIQLDGLRQLMHQEGKLISITFTAVPTVQLMFRSHEGKSEAENFRGPILQAFESVLNSPVTIIAGCAPENENGIISDESDRVSPRITINEDASSNARKSNSISSQIRPEHFQERRMREAPRQSLARSRVSLARVIQQAEGSQRSGWFRWKPTSIAEKLEQENLKLEPRSRNLFCWTTPRKTRQKLPQLKIKTRKPRLLLKLLPCSRCLSVKSKR